MIAVITNWADDSLPVKSALNLLIMLGIPFENWEKQTLSGDIPQYLDKYDAIIIDEERFRSCTAAEETLLENFARKKYIHIIPQTYKTASQCDNEYRAEIEINMFAAASGVQRTGLAPLSIETILPFYLRNMEEFYNNCVNNASHLHEYHLHSTASLLAAEKLGVLPPQWSKKINDIFESITPLITAPADFDEVACWGFARIAAQRCGHTRFLDRVKAESEGMLQKMCRAADGMLSMSGWPEDPLFFKRKDSIFFGSTRATTCWRDLHLNEQLHYFGAAFPVLSMTTGDMRFLNEAVALLDHIDQIHRDPADGLLRHASRDGHAVGEKWGRGLTHALSGAFYMLELAPDLPENIRKKVISFIDRTGDGLLKVQTGNGLWRNVLDHPETAEETSCSVLIAWIFAHCVNQKYLCKEKYSDMLLRAANALKSRIWRGMGAGNCRATYPGPDIQFYVRRPLHMHFLPFIIPALLEIENLKKG